MCFSEYLTAKKEKRKSWTCLSEKKNQAYHCLHAWCKPCSWVVGCFNDSTWKGRITSEKDSKWAPALSDPPCTVKHPFCDRHPCKQKLFFKNKHIFKSTHSIKSKHSLISSVSPIAILLYTFLHTHAHTSSRDIPSRGRGSHYVLEFIDVQCASGKLHLPVSHHHGALFLVILIVRRHQSLCSTPSEGLLSALQVNSNNWSAYSVNLVQTRPCFFFQREAPEHEEGMAFFSNFHRPKRPRSTGSCHFLTFSLINMVPEHQWRIIFGIFLTVQLQALLFSVSREGCSWSPSWQIPKSDQLTIRTEYEPAHILRMNDSTPPLWISRAY